MYKSLIFLLLLAVSSKAQSIFTGLGARAEGMGNASAALADGWGIFHNPGGTAWAPASEAYVAYALNPRLQGANRMGAGALHRLAYGTAGLAVFRFGDQLYSESLVSASFANRLGIAALGARLNYLQYRAEGFGTNNTLTLDAGGIAELTPQLHVGAWIQNLNRPRLNQHGQHTPVKMAAGMAFAPTSQLTLAAALEKDLDHPVTWKSGLEYAAHKRVFIRSGFNLNPDAVFFGLGFLVKQMQFDYALQYNRYLPAVHQGSIKYKLTKP